MAAARTLATSDRALPAASTLLSSADVNRTLDRMAHQIVERTASLDHPPVLLGIPTRGVVLAQRLADRLQRFSGRDHPVGSLDITLYRDDLNRRPPRSLGETRIPDGGIEDRLVILGDDVLFSGRTVRAALDALREFGRPAAVELAVLVDRGHRRLPIRADYVGKNLPTTLADKVSVHLIPVDSDDTVELKRA